MRYVGKGSVAGVMGNPIGTMGQDLGDNIDLNTIVNSGLYSTLSSQNQPDGYEEWYGLLAVSKFRTGEVIQPWTPNGTYSNGLFERKKNYNSNTWSNWQRIDNFGYNSFEGLAGGVAQNIGYGFKTGSLNGKADDIQQNAILLHANTDSTLPAAYGTLISFAPTTSHITQLYSVADNDLKDLYFRQRTSGTWSSWRKI